MDQQMLSAKQFGDSAANYLTSAVHATGEDLERLSALAFELARGEHGSRMAHDAARGHGGDGRQRQSAPGQGGPLPVRALDLGCGAGHASFALAKGGARHVTAYDPSSEMLAVVAKEAAARGHDVIQTRVGSAEALPFESGAFDLVVTRYSAHHWANVPRALVESARVLKPGGVLVAIDIISPEQPVLDTALQVLEFLRDGSHVRNYRLSEWSAMQKAAGFADAAVTSWKINLEFNSWIARIGTPPERVVALRTVLADLPGEAREYFRIGPDGSFTTDRAWMETRKMG